MEVTSKRLDALIHSLKALPSAVGLFNPYASASAERTADSRDEVGAEADQVRTHNLKTYLRNLLDAGADVILCGEAPSFAGCRFSGIAFSDEVRVSEQRFPFQGCQLLPAAASLQRPLMKERSASVVWDALGRAPVLPVLWNSIQLHPHPPGVALKNRTPRTDEFELGHESLRTLIELVRPRLVVAVGRTAEKALQQIDQPAAYVRHPAHGGHTQFLQGLEELEVIHPLEDVQGSFF